MISLIAVGVCTDVCSDAQNYMTHRGRHTHKMLSSLLKPYFTILLDTKKETNSTRYHYIKGLVKGIPLVCVYCIESETSIKFLPISKLGNAVFALPLPSLSLFSYNAYSSSQVIGFTHSSSRFPVQGLRHLPVPIKDIVGREEYFNLLFPARPRARARGTRRPVRSRGA